MKTVNSYNDVGDILCDRNKSDENEPLSNQLWVWELQIYFVYSPAKCGLTELWCFLCPEHEQATKQTVELPVIETPMAFMRNHCIMELLFECVHACWWENDSNSLQAYAWQESIWMHDSNWKYMIRCCLRREDRTRAIRNTTWRNKWPPGTANNLSIMLTVAVLNFVQEALKYVYIFYHLSTLI